MAKQKEEYQIQIKYGHVKVRSWFAVDGNKLVGMSSATEYDQDGNIVSFKKDQTGLVLSYS